MIYTIPEFQDISLTDDVCPIYTYLNNVYIYEYINIAKNIPLHQLSNIGRFVITIYNNYNALKKS